MSVRVEDNGLDLFLFHFIFFISISIYSLFLYLGLGISVTSHMTVTCPILHRFIEGYRTMMLYYIFYYDL